MSSISAVTTINNSKAEVSGSPKTIDNPLAELGSSQFLMLLMTQLKNQNPLEPMDDKEWMGQITQLNSLQELKEARLAMESTSRASQTSYAASLIGKHVRAGLEDGSSVEGVVTSITQSNGAITLQVGTKNIPLESVTIVTGA